MIDLLALLKRMECDDEGFCCECDRFQHDEAGPHEPDCQLKGAIDLLEGRATGEISFGVSKSIHIRPSPYADPL